MTAGGLRSARVARVALLLAACLWATTACGGGPPVVGVLLPLSGDQAQRGLQARRAIELAIEESGVTWEWIVRDTASRPGETVRRFAELVNDGADVVLGPLSTEGAEAAASLARALGVPMLSPGALDADLGADNEFAFRMAFRDLDAARQLATYARYTLELDRVAVIVDLADADSVALSAAFSEEFQRRRGVIAGERAYFGGPDDPLALASLLDEAAGLDVDGVFIPGRALDVRVMLQAAEPSTLASLVLLGGDGWDDPELCAAIHGRVKGAYHLGHFAADEPDDAGQAFARRFREQAGSSPGDAAALGYDAARILIELGAPGLSSRDWQQRLGALRRFEGVTGPISIDPQGAATRKPPRLLQCHDPSAPRFVIRLSG